MDILTPRGQRTARDESAAYRLWEQSNPGWSVIQTPKDQPASVDAFLVWEGEIRAVVECKCRYGIDFHGFEAKFDSEWLVTMDKVIRGASVARELCVPLVGFLTFADTGQLLCKEIADHTGQFTVPFRCENTLTQRTVNGGEAVRANAYINMRGAKIYSPDLNNREDGT